MWRKWMGEARRDGKGIQEEDEEEDEEKRRKE